LPDGYIEIMGIQHLFAENIVPLCQKTTFFQSFPGRERCLITAFFYAIAKK